MKKIVIRSSNDYKKDDCFKLAIANVLQLHPSKVPHFVRKHGVLFVEKARKWLNKRGKTITFCHIKSFLECGNVRYNHGIFPQGICIAIIGTHAEVMIDGKIVSPADRDGEFKDDLKGYFIIHDYKK